MATKTENMSHKFVRANSTPIPLSTKRPQAVSAELTTVANHSFQPSNSYIVASEDKRGHSGKISIRVPKSFTRAVAIIMEQRAVFGWETPGDFNRWAILYGIQHCTEVLKNPELGAVYHQMQAEAALNETTRNIEWFKNVVSSTRKNAELLNADGSPKIAQEMIRRVYDIIQTMPDNEFKEHNDRLFKSEFSAVIHSIEHKRQEEERKRKAQEADQETMRKTKHPSAKRISFNKFVPDANPEETAKWNEIVEQFNIEQQENR